MLAFATLWMSASVYFAQPWISDLTHLIGRTATWVVVSGIALIPGYANAFMLSGLLFDWRPRFRPLTEAPAVSVLIAAYNEASYIEETLQSFRRQVYSGQVELIVIDDGSRDGTVQAVRDYAARHRLPSNQRLRLIRMPRNGGKARALNAGLSFANHDLIITADADTLLYKDALANLVANQIRSPANTAATAGTILVRNSRHNLMTRLQEWDYFLGIAVVKRVQSLLQGTLVAQGAYSIYRRDVLEEVGGWQETVGEDIVLTWCIIRHGYRVGYAENAFAFTHVPETYGAFYRQRKRWSRGLIEAFKRYPGMLIAPRLNTPFIWLNFLFPYIDAAYLLVFIPGLIAALFFQFYAIVGIMTLLLIPLALMVNVLMFWRQLVVFRNYGLKVRSNVFGAMMFTLMYQLALAPASLMGYVSELINAQKRW